MIIADMSATTFCDCAGLRTLVAARDHATASGSALRIVVQPDGAVARSLAILGFDRMPPLYTSLRDAMPN
jgi:anti-anti-sigma factor